MNSKQFIKDSLRTEAPLEETTVAKETMRQLHAAVGVSTEAGELLDAFKKSLFYGQPLDRVNVLEEVGDILWYTALLLDSMGTDFETVASIVIDKLKDRYPSKFDVKNSKERDVSAERQTMEARACPPNVRDKDAWREKQKEDIQKAKEKGVYKGRAPLKLTTKLAIVELLDKGHSPSTIKEILGVGRTSIFKIKKELRDA